MFTWGSSGAFRRALVRAGLAADIYCLCMHCRWNRSNAEAVAAAVRGGATLVQVREKDADGGAFLQQASSACF